MGVPMIFLAQVRSGELAGMPKRGGGIATVTRGQCDSYYLEMIEGFKTR